MVSFSYRKVLIAYRLIMSHQCDVPMGNVNVLILGCIKG